MKKITMTLFALTMTTMLTACDVSTTQTSIGSLTQEEIKLIEQIREEYVWPSMGLATTLPTPKTKAGEIRYDEEDKFTIIVYGTSDEEHMEYISKCQKETDYTNDYVKVDNYYRATSDDGVELCVSRYKKYDVISSTYISLDVKSE